MMDDGCCCILLDDGTVMTPKHPLPNVRVPAFSGPTPTMAQQRTPKKLPIKTDDKMTVTSYGVETLAQAFSLPAPTPKKAMRATPGTAQHTAPPQSRLIQLNIEFFLGQEATNIPVSPLMTVLL